MKAIILVGGPSRGTRFRPLSLSHPKPLFPIAGKPMVFHYMQAFASLEQMEEILLIGFFEPALFQPFIDEVASQFQSINIRYLREYQPLGTGGGLYHFRNQILRGNPDLIFVVNSDVCCAFPFQEMLQFHRKHEGICTILGTHVPKEIATRYGCLVAKDGTGEVLHYVEKPETFVSDLISCGVYLFSPEIFKDIKVLMEPSSGSDFIDSEVIRLEQDVLQPLAGTGRLFVFETTEFWRQIKTAGSAVPANTLYLYQYAKTGSSMLAVPQKDGPTIVGNVYIHPTAHVHPSAKLGPNVSIGPRVTIGKGVRVKESIILDNVEVKSHACILYSIIGWNAKIGCWCRIEGTPPYSVEKLSPASNISNLGSNVWTQSWTDLMLQNGMKNQSVTILGENVQVQNETCVRNCIVLPHKELKNSHHNEILM